MFKLIQAITSISEIDLWHIKRSPKMLSALCSREKLRIQKDNNSKVKKHKCMSHKNSDVTLSAEWVHQIWDHKQKLFISTQQTTAV